MGTDVSRIAVVPEARNAKIQDIVEVPIERRRSTKCIAGALAAVAVEWNIAAGYDLALLSECGKLETIGQGLGTAFKAALAIPRFDIFPVDVGSTAMRWTHRLSRNDGALT